MPKILEKLDYDSVILGTGLTSSILAASLAVARKSVLHLDPQPFYGSISATLSVDQWDSLLDENRKPPVANWTEQDNGEAERLVKEKYGEKAEYAPIRPKGLREVAFPFGVRRWRPTASRDGFQGVKGDIFLDLDPRGLYAAGEMVSLLERTNVGYYVNFKALEGLYVEFGEGGGGLQKVPASRSDVFQNRFVTMVEKRLLMRFLKRCLAGDDFGQELPNFDEAMRTADLTDKLKFFVRHAISFTDDAELSTAREGTGNVRLYQESLAKYKTPTPFLFANYGSGDLAQGFCRLCAVNGGVYVLQRGLKGIIRAGETRKLLGVVTTEDEVVRSDHVFLESSLVEGNRSDQSERWWRFCAVLDRSILNEQGKFMVVVPRGTVGNNTSTVRIRQLDSSLMVCPQNYFLLYAETVNSEGSEEDLITALSYYIKMDNEDSQSSKPGVLWGVSYACGRDEEDFSSRENAGLQLIKKSDPECTCKNVLIEAERCFRSLRLSVDYFQEPSNFHTQIHNGG